VFGFGNFSAPACCGWGSRKRYQRVTKRIGELLKHRKEAKGGVGERGRELEI